MRPGEPAGVVDPPQLLGTVTVKNASEDHAVRLIAGEVTYLNGMGQPIRSRSAWKIDNAL